MSANEQQPTEMSTDEQRPTENKLSLQATAGAASFTGFIGYCLVHIIQAYDLSSKTFLFSITPAVSAALAAFLRFIFIVIFTDLNHFSAWSRLQVRHFKLWLRRRKYPKKSKAKEAVELDEKIRETKNFLEQLDEMQILQAMGEIKAKHSSKLQEAVGEESQD